MRKNIKFPIRNWQNVLQGEPVFILGNSPSISNQNISILKDYFTIGINRIYYLMQPTILFWQDKDVYYYKGYSYIKNCHSIKYCRDIADTQRKYNTFRIRPGGYAFTGKVDEFQGYGCSAAIACQLAHAMGCGAMVLIGCDGNYASDGKTDFYGVNNCHKKHTLKNFQRAYHFIKKYSPVPVLCCSENEFWPYISVEDAVEQLRPTPKSLGQWCSMLYS